MPMSMELQEEQCTSLTAVLSTKLGSLRSFPTHGRTGRFILNTELKMHEGILPCGKGSVF